MDCTQPPPDIQTWTYCNADAVVSPVLTTVELVGSVAVAITITVVAIHLVRSLIKAGKSA